MIRAGARALFIVLSAFFALIAPASANPWILVDAGSGDIIAHNQATRLWHPASITKLMTAYTVFGEISKGRIDLLSPVRVTKLAASMPSSKMGLPVGTIMNVDNALKMIMVKSANDIAVALAEATSGSLAAFVKAMNVNAARLGMTRSTFTNPHGLHAGEQVTTAKDMVLLALAIQNQYPHYAHYLNIPAIRFGKVRMKNHNRLLFDYPGTNGMKTGYTCPSGLNVVARARRGDKQLIAVVLGGYSSLQRNIRVAKLFNYGFGDKANAVNRTNRYGLVNNDPPIHVTDLNPQLNLYQVPVNLKPVVCKPSWSERRLSKKQRRANRNLHRTRVKQLNKVYFDKKVKPGPTQRVFLGRATGLNPFNIKMANGDRLKPLAGLPKIPQFAKWRPDRALPPYE